MPTQQYNFDGIPGPTHQYQGLGYGNVLSQVNAGRNSSPRLAALQGLNKARTLQEKGFPQALLPPLTRPYLQLLVQAGLLDRSELPEALDHSNLDQLAMAIERAAREEPALVAACFSASGMWVANWATVAPSADTLDGKVHFTVANLASNLHRSIERAEIAQVLRSIFSDNARFTVHAPLPASAAVADEGAANHMRLARAHGDRGLHLMVYGTESLRGTPQDGSYVGRQTRIASRCLTASNALSPDRWLLLPQSSAAISAGIFHNDVICMSNLDLVLCHERAFRDQAATRERVVAGAADSGVTLNWVEIPDAELSLDWVVKSYFFNSQLIRTTDGATCLVCESRLQSDELARGLIARLQNEAVIQHVVYVDLDQSLRNGGGPACVRLRVELNDEERAAIGHYRGIDPAERVWDRLETIVRSLYRDEWVPDTVPSGPVLRECFEATFQIRECLGLR
jgi:succinylarginine dihydrolase